MSNQSNNPLSKLLDIDFPDVKKANWNNSFDHTTTSDVGYAKPVFVDRVLANTRCKLDIDQASFANPTVSPLLGRYRVKYLAFWAPDRLYIAPWRNGDMVTSDDNYSYPVIPSYVAPTSTPTGVSRTYARLTGLGHYYVAPTSLASYLGIYPANYDASCWDSRDVPTDSNAFSFLAFWDIYRHYIMNVQEPLAPVRNKAFYPEVINVATDTLDNDVTQISPALNPEDVSVSRENLDTFFRRVLTEYDRDVNMDVLALWKDVFHFDPIYSPKRLQYFGGRFATTSNGYLAPSVAVDSSDSPLTNRDIIDGVVIQHDYHHGLPVAPYSPDIFNSWISNENVELERTSAKMDVSNGTLFMEQWVMASRIQNKTRKSIFKHSDFAEYIDQQYGIRPSTSLSKPMFMGAFIRDIVFNDVVSTSQTGDAGSSMNSNKNLGSRAGYGRGTDYSKHSFVDFTAQEPGTLMVLQIILPEPFYYEGRDEMYDVQNFNEEFNPAFDGVGFTPLQKSTMNLVPHTSQDPLGRLTYEALAYSTYNTSIGQQPYGMRHMAKSNMLSGQMAEFSAYLTYALARSFNYVRGLYNTSNQSLGRPYSTYIIPEMFTNIFASNTVDNFQFYLNFDYLKYQPISKQFLSFNY